MDDATLLTIIEHTPLVSIDLIIPSAQGQLLMGWRVNEPAAGSWFVPGGRIRKEESLQQAFDRLVRVELECSIPFDGAQLMGAFTHLYPTNYLKRPGISTHYVVLGYRVDVAIDLDRLPTDQHSRYRWIGRDDDLRDVHPNSSAYFDCL